MEGVCRMNDVGLAFEDLENLLLPVKLPPFLIFFPSFTVENRLMIQTIFALTTSSDCQPISLHFSAA